MAEVVHPGTGPRTPVRQMTPLNPLGVGISGPPSPDRMNFAVPASPGRAVWAAGPGAGGRAAAAMKPDLVSPSGLRHRQMAPYGGASEAPPQQAQPHDPSTNIRKTIKEMAGGPYQKEAAIRAAENAIRPWSAYAGLGERRGAQFADQAVGRQLPHGMLQYGQDPQAPSRFTLPDAAYAAAVAASVNKVARPGTAQMGTAGSYSPVLGHPARELWPVDLNLPPKYCTGCRGEHDPENEQNPLWEPYTPTMRLTGLNMLQSHFVKALLNQQLCVAINDDSRINPVRWTWKVKDKDGDDVLARPQNFAKEDFIRQLALMYDGLREGHEPYRHLATQAAIAFLDTRSPHVPDAVPELIKPLRLAMQTYEPSLLGHAVLMLQRLVLSHPKVAKKLTPHLRHLFPPMAFLKRNHFTVHLPPPFCTSPAGSFTGLGFAPEAGKRKCAVCGCPLDKELASRRAKLLAEKKRIANPHLMNDEAGDVPQEYERHPIKGRWSKKYVLEDLINETLDLLIEKGGKPALQEVLKSFPTYSYHNPKD